MRQTIPRRSAPCGPGGAGAFPADGGDDGAARGIAQAPVTLRTTRLNASGSIGFST